MFRKVSRRLAVLVIAVSGGFLASPAGAQEESPVKLACDPGFYQVISGQLAAFNPGTGEYRSIGQDYSNYNAMGYRIEDGLLYGIAGQTLYRIDAEGTRQDMGTLAIDSGAYTGDFGDDGLLHISRGGRDWYKVDVDTLTATSVPELSEYAAVADITNVHGKFYGSSSDGTLYIFDPVALTVTASAPIAGLPDTLAAYGAAWSTAGGNLYIGRNSGQIYQVTGYSSDTPVATQVGTATATNSNDGASCSLAAVPAGLNDVDGPEPETEPSTPEAIAATQTYIESFEEISKTFNPPVTSTETPVVETAVIITTNESSPPVEDAGIGQGATCGETVNVDRPERFATEDIVRVETATPLFTSSFDDADMSAFQILSGNWNVADGALNQLNACGFDYTAILPEHVVDTFRWEASFSSISGANHGGLLFNQSSSLTRSGAILVDFADNGSTLRWGYYDDKGYYTAIGSVAVQAPAVGQSVAMAVEVHGQSVTLSVDGVTKASFVTQTSGGMVGLVSSQTDIAFEKVALTALPARNEA